MGVRTSFYHDELSQNLRCQRTQGDGKYLGGAVWHGQGEWEKTMLRTTTRWRTKTLFEYRELYLY